jgi:hypothetical protein
MKNTRFTLPPGDGTADGSGADTGVMDRDARGAPDRSPPVLLFPTITTDGSQRPSDRLSSAGGWNVEVLPPTRR